MTTAVSLPAAQVGRSTPQPQIPKQRKKPHCTRCGNPMQGHKRGQCIMEEHDVYALGRGARVAEVDVTLVAQLSNIDIKDENTKHVHFEADDASSVLARAVLSIPEELMSLASEDKTILHALARPGMLSNEITSADGKEKMERLGDWLERVQKPQRGRKPRSSAPPDVPSRNVFDAVLKQKERPRSVSPEKQYNKGCMRLEKASSFTEREEFLSELAARSKKDVTNVYRVDLDEIPDLEAKARRLKLHARVIAPKYKDGTTGTGWLVVGRNKSEVEETFKSVEKDAKGGSKLATLGTLATGAVACWMYLAFS